MSHSSNEEGSLDEIDLLSTPLLVHGAERGNEGEHQDIHMEVDEAEHGPMSGDAERTETSSGEASTSAQLHEQQHTPRMTP
ncbi:hypothetical protein EDD11_009934, partial [Mortierella claussenii]